METSVEDENGIVHPSRAHQIAYENWRPGLQMLGRGIQQQVEAIVGEYMQEMHDAATVSRAEIIAFQNQEQDLWNECWNRIEEYERVCTEYRSHQHINTATGQKFYMHPFNWMYVDASEVRRILRLKDGQSLLPRTVLEREKIAMFTGKKSKSMWREPMRSKSRFSLSEQELDSQPAKAFAEKQKTGEYPVLIKESGEAIFADVAKKYGPEFRSLRKKKTGPA